MVDFKSSSVEATNNLAAKLADSIQAGAIVLLDGPLGSGKTAFVRAFGKRLGVQGPIKSPTYTIVKSYDLPEKDYPMVHMDAYRLEEGGQETVDLDAYLAQKAVLLIEWPKFIEEFLPDSFIHLVFSLEDGDNRKISINPSYTSDALHDQIYQHWMKKVGEGLEL